MSSVKGVRVVDLKGPIQQRRGKYGASNPNRINSVLKYVAFELPST